MLLFPFISIVGVGERNDFKSPKSTFLCESPFLSEINICMCTGVCVCVCVHKSLCGIGTSLVAQWLRLGFQCRGPSVISACGSSAHLGVWQKKSLYDIVLCFPLIALPPPVCWPSLSLPCLFILSSLLFPQPLSLLSLV